MSAVSFPKVVRKPDRALGHAYTLIITLASYILQLTREEFCWQIHGAVGKGAEFMI